MLQEVGEENIMIVERNGISAGKNVSGVSRSEIPSAIILYIAGASIRLADLLSSRFFGAKLLLNIFTPRKKKIYIAHFDHLIFCKA